LAAHSEVDSDGAQVSVETAGNVLLVAVAVPAVLCVLAYARVPWWRTEIGRHLMAFMAIVALLTCLGVVRIVFHPAWFDALRTALFALFPVVVWWRFLLILKEQRETGARRGRRVEREDAREP
jgi:hypothetical protein